MLNRIGTARFCIGAQRGVNIPKRWFSGPGGQWSPSAGSHLTYFTDDLDMPVVDKYGTQEPIALLRCFTDYELWCEPG